MSASNPFNPRLVFGLIAAGIVTFAALVLLLAFGGNRIGPIHDSRAPALSVSATGFKGLVTLVGHFRETREISGTEDLSTDDLVVVALDPRNRAEDVQRLLDLRRDRATLIILPKWVTMPDPNHRAWVRALGPGAGPEVRGSAARPCACGLAAAPTPDQRARGEDFLEGLTVSRCRATPRRSAAATGLRPLVTLPNGDALIARMGAQPHYVAADPDLFDNHGLHDPAQARAALALIDGLNATDAEAIGFDLTVNGLGATQDNSPSLLRTLLEPPFLAMTLALLAAALLAGLHGAFRFGQARREERAIAFGKAALVENSAGLIRIARRETRLGGAYADVVRQDAARIGERPRLADRRRARHLSRPAVAGGQPQFQRAGGAARGGARPARAGRRRARTLFMEEGHHPVNVTDVKALADGIRQDVAKAIVGQDEAVELMLIALFSSGHILLEGPPGTAKTFLAQCFARVRSGSISGASSSPRI